MPATEYSKSSPTFISYGISTFLIILFVGFHLFSTLSRVENVAHDFFFRQRAVLFPIPAHPDIIAIEIAEDGIRGVGRWPWRRNYHAVLTHILKEWGARAVVFDILFSEPGDPTDDAALEEAIAQSQPHVYLPVILEPGADQQNSWIHSIPIFEKNARTGHINIKPDSDGILRRIHPYIQTSRESHPHLAIQLAMDILNKSSVEDFHFPLDRDGALIINWAGTWTKTFRHYSYLDVLQGFQEQQSGRTPVIGPEAVHGKICFVGLTATGLSDIKANPIESAAPALGVHLNVLNSILQYRYAHPAAGAVNALALLFLGTLSTFLFTRFRNYASIVWALVIAGGWTLASFAIFLTSGVLVNVVGPALLVFSLLAVLLVFQLIFADFEKQYLTGLAIRDGLTGLFSIRHFKDLLEKTIRQSQKISQPLSVILIDIDNFKKVNDTYGHQAGDMVLRGTAQSIQNQTRYKRAAEEADVVARYGGEEIIIMLRKTDLSLASSNVAERVRKAVEETKFTWEGTVIPVTISLGVSTLRLAPETAADTMEKIIGRADAALYQAKKTGKNRVCVEEGSVKSST